MRAVIIGINKYPSFEQKNLSGAVADANKMEAYIRKFYPHCGINNLRDEEASREAIIKLLRSLSKDDKIKHGDPILIYFAGHGTRGEKVSSEIKTAGNTNSDDTTGMRGGSPSTKMSAMIEMICPSDIGSSANPLREPVYGIPDTTLAEILNEIALEKGNNIVRHVCSIVLERP